MRLFSKIHSSFSIINFVKTAFVSLSFGTMISTKAFAAETQSPFIDQAYAVSYQNGKIEKSIPLLRAESSVGVDVNVDPFNKLQDIWGFGASVTEACLTLMKDATPETRNKMMTSFFDPEKGHGLSYLRIPIGGNDFALSDHTLDDTDGNKEDPDLKNFKTDRLDPLLDFVLQAQKINPNIKVMISPWSAPAWMKANKNLRGGELEPKHFSTYANYLLKTIEHIQKKGIRIDALTVMNEPLINDAKSWWYFQQGYMDPVAQKNFIDDFFTPLLKKNRLSIKILAHDHNWDNSWDILHKVKNKEFKSKISGLAYHCYGGGYEALKKSLALNAGVPSFNTECTSVHDGSDPGGTFHWWMQTQSVDAVREGTSGGLAWNLCLNKSGGPKNGGCDKCRGLITLDKENGQDFIQESPELFSLGQTARFVQPGSKMVDSNRTESLGIVNVAFVNSKNQIVVVLRNTTDQSKNVNLKIKNIKVGSVSIPRYTASTLVLKNLAQIKNDKSSQK